MNRQSLEQLMDKWIGDVNFRNEVRQDLEGTVRRTGVALDDEDWSAIRSLDWDLSDEELKSRINNPMM